MYDLRRASHTLRVPDAPPFHLDVRSLVQPLSVLLVSEYLHPRVGGIETHVLTLARNLARIGVRVEVATAYPGPTEIDGIRIHRIPTPLLPGLGVVYTTHGVRPFESLLRTRGFDVVHCHLSVYGPASMAAAWLSQRMAIPTVVTFHSVVGSYLPAYRFFDHLTGWSRLPVHWTAVSALVAGQIEEVLGGTEVEVLPSAVDPDEWTPHDEWSDSSAFDVVSTLRLAPRKRPLALLDALAEAQARLSPAIPLRARLIGEGPERTALERTIERRGLERTITLVGSCTPDRIREEYRTADTFALASIEESFGLAALEARSCGLPVVVRSATGPAEFIRHEVEGLVATDDTDFVRCLVRLAEDVDLRRRIRDHNRNTPPALQWNGALRRHLDLYRAIVRSSA